VSRRPLRQIIVEAWWRLFCLRGLCVLAMRFSDLWLRLYRGVLSVVKFATVLKRRFWRFPHPGEKARAISAKLSEWRRVGQMARAPKPMVRVRVLKERVP
jgi:hypothetical protein